MRLVGLFVWGIGLLKCFYLNQKIQYKQKYGNISMPWGEDLNLIHSVHAVSMINNISAVKLNSCELSTLLLAACSTGCSKSFCTVQNISKACSSNNFFLLSQNNILNFTLCQQSTTVMNLCFQHGKKKTLLSFSACCRVATTHLLYRDFLNILCVISEYAFSKAVPTEHQFR